MEDDERLKGWDLSFHLLWKLPVRSQQQHLGPCQSLLNVNSCLSCTAELFTFCIIYVFSQQWIFFIWSTDRTNVLSCHMSVYKRTWVPTTLRDWFASTCVFTCAGGWTSIYLNNVTGYVVTNGKANSTNNDDVKTFIVG